MERIRINELSLAVDFRGDGPAVLFIHGFPLDRMLWRHQVAELTGWWRIAPDLRGFGESDAPASGYSMAAYAEDLLSLLDLLGVRRAVLVGLSMGGYIAFEILRRRPERVAGLVLMDTRADPDTPEGTAARDLMIATARERGALSVAEAMLPKLLGEDSLRERPEVVGEVRRMMERAPVAGIVGALESMKARPDSRPLLPHLGGMPVLAVVGEQDRIVSPTVMRTLADAIPGAEFEVVSGAGHVPPLERPGLVTDRIARFLSRV